MNPATRRRVRLQKAIAAGEREVVRSVISFDAPALSYAKGSTTDPVDVTPLAAEIVETGIGFWERVPGKPIETLVLVPEEKVELERRSDPRWRHEFCLDVPTPSGERRARMVIQIDDLMAYLATKADRKGQASAACGLVILQLEQQAKAGAA